MSGTSFTPMPAWQELPVLPPPLPGDTPAREPEEARLRAILERYRPVSVEGERTADMPQRQWAVEGLVPAGELTIVGGRKGMGKSWLVLQLGKAVASGEAFLGQATTRGSVLYWPSELDRTGLHERAQRLGRVPATFDAMPGLPPRGDGLLDVLPGIIRGYGYLMVIIDMLQAVLPEGADANDYRIGSYLLALRHVAMDTAAAVVGTWHTGKADRGDPVLSLLGSTAVGAQAGSIITIERRRGEDAALLHVSGNHAGGQSLRLRVDRGLFGLAEDGQDREPGIAPSDGLVLEAVKARPDGSAVSTLAGTVGKSTNSIRAALYRLGVRGLVEKRGQHWYPVETHEVHDTLGAHGAHGAHGAFGALGALESHEAHGSTLRALRAPGLDWSGAHRTAPAPIGAVRPCAPQQQPSRSGWPGVSGPEAATVFLGRPFAGAALPFAPYGEEPSAGQVPPPEAAPEDIF